MDTELGSTSDEDEYNNTTFEPPPHDGDVVTDNDTPPNTEANAGDGTQQQDDGAVVTDNDTPPNTEANAGDGTFQPQQEDDDITDNDTPPNTEANAGDGTPQPQQQQVVPANRDNKAAWDEAIIAAFMSKEVAFQLEIGGIPQCFVRKQFRMDSNRTVIHCFVDLEVQDKTPPLYHYNVLSAHFNSTLKTLCLSQSVVKHVDNQAKYIVLAILRSKCTGPKYEAVLMDLVQEETIFRIPLTRLRQEYEYFITEAIHHDTCEKAFQKWVVEKGLVWDKTRPNKLENGSPDHAGWHPPTRRSRTATVPPLSRDPTMSVTFQLRLLVCHHALLCRQLLQTHLCIVTV
jgi:hypothetical protein